MNHDEASMVPQAARGSGSPADRSQTGASETASTPVVAPVGDAQSAARAPEPTSTDGLVTARLPGADRRALLKCLRARRGR